MISTNDLPNPCLNPLNLFIILILIISAWAPLILSAVTVTQLPGFLQGSTLPFHLETGYIEVDELYGVELFYYFIESERNPKDDPLLLWFTGGPGCSAFSGLAIEIGPLKFKSEKYYGSLPNLVYNPYSWTKVSSIIFVDAPVGTGFSFSRHPKGYESGDNSWSKHAEIFLKKWFRDHPEFLPNPLYVAGDSYAGKIVPLVVHRLLNDHEFGNQPLFNIQGYMVGNPVTGEGIDYNARVPFALGMGIISDELFQTINSNCKGELTYNNPKNAICASKMKVFDGFTSEIMTSQVLEPKCSLAAPKYIFPVGIRSVLQGTHTNLFSPPVPEVKCRGTVNEWQRCNNDLIFTEDVTSSIPYHVNLTKRGYRALVYSGDHDMIVPFIGTKEWIRSLKYLVTNKWRSWHVGGQVAGYTESYANDLTFATVKGAGHTAPEYKPKECLAMFKRWISQKPL